MTAKISILTLVHQREKALRNTLDGIARGTVLPQEVIVVYMNTEGYDLPLYPFSVKSIFLSTDNGLNLAEARNIAIASSNCNLNIFLDVDCIPKENLVKLYVDALQSEDILWSGRVRYLPKDVSEIKKWTTQLHTLSLPDPIRGEISEFPYELFWSLNFACSKNVFAKIGGFDVGYCGYGGEDTDFAYKARESGIRLKTLSATAFHQYHPCYSPPVNHLADIVHNAMIFRNKWKKWPMEGWLEAFRNRGLIEWDENYITVTRAPTKAELRDCLK